MSSSILFPTNEYTTSNKSYEEIQKLMIQHEEPIDALKYIFMKENALQLPYAYSCFYLYPKELLELVCVRLGKEDTENQILIVESLNKLNPNEKESKIIFEALLQSLKNWSTINNKHLVEALEVLVEKTVNKSEFLEILDKTIIEMGKSSQPIVSKVIAGRMIPIVAKYGKETIKGEMIDIIKKIINDHEIEAKKIWIAEIFPKLLMHLKLEFIELHLQEKLYETVYDENEEIGLMALEVILRNTTRFSLEEQSSRIVKLYIDSLISKNEKVVLLATSFMGEIFQRLQNIILKNETHCLRFWKSFIEVAESKNEQIINNFVYNLPGVLLLSKKYHRVDALCDVYAELFYHTQSDTSMLVSYFHEMVKMFPSKRVLLRDTFYSLFSEIFEEGEISDEGMKIIDILIINLNESREVFIEEIDDEDNQGYMKITEEGKIHYFDEIFCEYLFKYLNICISKKNGKWLKNVYVSINKCYQYFSPSFVEISLLPKLYSAIRSKSAYLEELVHLIILFLSRECSTNFLVNNYVSKINVELSKSLKSHEREGALLFYYYSTYDFSIDTFQEFKMGEKFLSFSNEKSLKNKLKFIEFAVRVNYFLTNEEKIEYTIILNKLRKDGDIEIVKFMDKTDFKEYENVKNEIVLKSKEIKEKEKTRCALSKKGFLHNRRETIKDLKKEDVLKKRVETRSRTKILIKEASKKKTTMSMVRPMLRKNS